MTGQPEPEAVEIPPVPGWMFDALAAAEESVREQGRISSAIVVRAALPAIREGLAKEIEAELNLTWYPPTEVGSPPSYGYGIQDAIAKAARIVRGQA